MAVGWTWKAGGTAVTNTTGTISSQVSANPTAGFSVVTWTGNGVTAATVGTEKQEQALQKLSDFGQEMDRLFRNEVLEEVAVEIDKMKGDTAFSFAVFVRNMKR